MLLDNRLIKISLKVQILLVQRTHYSFYLGAFAPKSPKKSAPTCRGLLR